ncbi:MAG: hypothetical protein AAB229_07410 [Candidatus Hydrogenedentota bacterium]
MRIGGQEVKPTWLIGGGLGVLLLAGLFFDVWQSYARRKNLEFEVADVAGIAAKYLPFRPREARQAAIVELEKRGLPVSDGSVTVAPDGYSLEIYVNAEATAYFAWIVGNPKMQFQAKKSVSVELDGGGPVEEYPALECGFAIKGYEGFSVGQNVIISLSGDTDVPDYAVKAYRIKGPANLVVGQKAVLEPMSSFENYASPQEAVVVILGEFEDNAAPVKGFAALDAEGLDQEGRITGRFIRKMVSGEIKTQLPADANFGLLKGGTPRYTFK